VGITLSVAEGTGIGVVSLNDVGTDVTPIVGVALLILLVDVDVGEEFAGVAAVAVVAVATLPDLPQLLDKSITSIMPNQITSICDFISAS
jgi:hypothetical protein